MASLQLAQGDTASAITEMELAVQLQPNDPVLLYNYATTLVRARRDGDAATQLGKSVAADSFYAQPHMLLARMADVEQYTDDAVREYQIFLALAREVRSAGGVGKDEACGAHGDGCGSAGERASGGQAVSALGEATNRLISIPTLQ